MNIEIPDTVTVFVYSLYTIYFLIVSVRIFEEGRRFFKRGRSKYIFDSNSWPKGWIFSGRPEIIDGDLHVKQSRAGILFEEKLWKDFRMTFAMKFDASLYPKKHLGVIFRAADLDNYFMIEVRGGTSLNENGLAPHIRFKSGWQVTGVVSDLHLSLDEFKNITLLVKNDTAIFSYEDKECFKWDLPTHADISHFEAGVDGNNKSKEEATLTKNLSGNHVQRISFRSDYGMIGFRAHHDNQGGIIRNLKIEKL